MPADNKAKKLMKVYKDRLTWIEEFVDFVENYRENEHRAELHSQLKALEETKMAFEEARQNVLYEDEGADEEQLRSDRKEFLKKYHKVRGFINELQKTDVSGHPMANSTMANTTTASVKMRLPKLELPSFDGNITQWVTYKDRFVSLVHDVPELPEVAKLQYLLASLKGEAALQFEHVPLEEKSYAPTWETLLQRYDNNKLLRREYFKALIQLEPMNATTASELTRIVNETRRLVEGMKRLEEPTQHWNTPLTTLVMYKFDNTTLMAYEHFAVENETDTYDQMMQFCEKRIRILNSTALHSLGVIGTRTATKTHQQNRASNPTTNRSSHSYSVTCAAQSSYNVKRVCPICKADHVLMNCTTFGSMPVLQREGLAKEHKLCFSCLKGNHQMRFCRNVSRCGHCNGKHNTLLCKRQEQIQVAAQTAQVEQSLPDAEEATTINATTREAEKTRDMVWLSTALVWVLGSDGEELPARALLDQGSQSNFITERLAQQLKLKRVRMSRPLSGIGAVMVNATSMVSARIRSRVSDFQTLLQFLVLPRVTSDYPSRLVEVKQWKIPPGIALADPAFNKPEKIDMLIGAGIFAELLEEGKLRLASYLPRLLETKLGWIVSGSMSESKENKANEDIVGCAIDEQFNAAMERLVRLEDIPEEKLLSTEEQICEDFYSETTRRNDDGRYVVQLPKVNNFEQEMGDSYDVSLKRFGSVERRMKRDECLREEYHKFMDEYIQLGHMTKATDEQSNNGIQYYLPHHAVWKLDSTTTKCRVVFDASCKTDRGKSLNDILLTGPQLQDDIVSILMRFRFKCVAMVADVEKMYRQILVDERDRNLQRIFWRANESEPVSIFRLNTVTYGTACAPYLAIRTLRRIFEDGENEFPASKEWYNDFYVDDLISGAESEERAKTVRREVVELLARAGFKLRKWASNCSAALDEVPEEDVAKTETHELNAEKSIISTLGVIWQPRTDEISVRVPNIMIASSVTKRNVMGAIARIYDPLGFVDPVKMLAKMLMQQLWRLKDIDGMPWPWDKELPESLCREWMNLVRQLHVLQDVKLPRLVCSSENVQYHIFCDASEQGYGACMYVRSVYNSAGAKVQLLISRSKVAPLAKRLTIARLELCAALLGSRLWDFAKKARLKEGSCFLWTDSMTTWHWIQSPHHLWKTFVGNRTAKIQLLTAGCNWRHVPGVDNPADLVSRGCEPMRLLHNTLWWSGPSWLSEPEEKWPILPEARAITTGEERKVELTVASVNEEKFVDWLFNRYSSFAKLRLIVGYCLRCLQGVRTRLKREIEQHGSSAIPYETRILTTEERLRSERVLCRLAQQQGFEKELKCLSSGKEIPRSSPLRGYKPFIDAEGIIRLNGRIQNAHVRVDAKNPIAIPKNHVLGRMVAEDFHVKQLHAGAQATLTAIRQRFWLFGGRSIVKQVCHKCVKCFKCNPKGVTQPMAELPANRVTEARPFAISGVDYCGPVWIKAQHRRGAPTKAFVAVFVCFVTRAVHLELVSDLSTQAFLAALRRFVARRGLVTELHSDNGTNFKGAANELHNLYEMLCSPKHREEVAAWSAERAITWKFIPPRAPHFGGLWEAAVRSMKFHLIRVLGNASASYEDMTTLLTEIEACLNSRPITPLSDDPSDFEALTPGHFLTGSHLQNVVDIDLKDVPDNRLNHWRLVRKRLQQFWVRWKTEYLQQLHARTKWNGPATSIVPGMLVLLREDNVPPTKWPLARVLEAHPGRDGVVRVVTLRTSNAKEIKRPVVRICIFPVQ